MMGRRHDLPEQEIADRYRSGESLEQIGRSYGVALNTIKRRLIQAGVQMRPAGRASAALPTDEIVARYKAGETLTGIAQHYECRFTTIRHIVQEAGVRLRPRGWALIGKPSKLRLNVDEATIVSKYESGHSVANIADDIGASATFIHSRLRKLGVQARSPHSTHSSIAYAEQALLHE